MVSSFNVKGNSSGAIPLDTQYEVNKVNQTNFEIEDLSIKKIVIISHPILKALALLFLLGTTSALSSSSLINPVVAAEMIRLIFVCAIALLIQREGNSRLYYEDRIVKTFLYS